TSVTLGGSNAGDFSVSANSCTGATVAVNATCSVSVKFTPSALGTRSASLSFADDAPDSPESVAISGVGVQSLPSGVYLQDGFESGNLSLWSTPAGTGSATVENTVTNSGNDALALTNAANQYVILSQNLTGGAQSHTFTRLYFRLTNAGLSATLAAATDSSGNNLWAVVYDAGDHGFDIYFWNGARTRYDFYSAANLIQSNTWYALEIEDNETTSGAGNIWLNGNALGGVTGDLSATNAVSRLYLWNDASGGTTYFDDVIVSNQYNGPLGATPAISFTPVGVNFGNQGVGVTSSAQKVTVKNTGTASLNLTAVALVGTNKADFAITADTCTGASLGPGGTCSVSLTFTPGAAGSRSASLSFTDNAPASPQSVALGGTGTVPTPGISFNPGSLSFSSQGVGSTSAAQTITITNTGSANLHITSVTLGGSNAGDFSVSANSCTGATVAVNATCSVSVTFSPSATGSRTASLTFADDAPNSPQNVPLSGTGTQAGIYLQDGFESGNLNAWSVGGTGTATVENTVVNSGNEALALTNASGQYEILSQNLTGGAQSHTFTRLYFRLSNASLSATVAVATDNNGNNLWAVVYDAGSHGLDVYFWNGARTRYDFYSAANLIQANTWYA
ncbi:MAG TPA: choice-of-anchor D domain-containing protein, partial [Ktedonobacterales bacterium]|nr:choice-of-anchor D domain-containing protein [Ktedonobacterales bacterium]